MFPLLYLGPIAISTYFLVISVAISLSAYWFVRRAQSHRLSQVTAIDLGLVVLVNGLIGARLLHVFFEEPTYYHEQPWRLLQVWQGGFVYFGGAIAGMLSAWAFCWLRDEPFLLWADLAAPPAALAYAFGRIGCMLNGCCYGKVCQLPWAIWIAGAPRHPTPLYAAGIEFIILGVLLWSERRSRMAGQIFAAWLALHGINRFFMEVHRDDPRGPELANMSLGQWLSLVLIVVGIGLWVWRSTVRSRALET